MSQKKSQQHRRLVPKFLLDGFHALSVDLLEFEREQLLDGVEWRWLRDFGELPEAGQRVKIQLNFTRARWCLFGGTVVQVLCPKRVVTHARFSSDNCPNAAFGDWRIVLEHQAEWDHPWVVIEMRRLHDKKEWAPKGTGLH